MKITETKIKYTVCEQSGNGIPVIIVSAGSSSRMGGINKQFLPLCGVPVIARTLSAFEGSPCISRIILVCRESDINEMQLIAEKYGIEKLSDIVAGGADRSASVFCGIERLTADEKKVLIHDGARPFADNRIIADAVAALETFDASLPAVKVIDTVKRAADDGTVTETVPRDGLYCAQTPQGVDVAKYREAAARFAGDTVTDDASIMEKAGYSVRIVEGDRKNIKITTPNDAIFAEMIIRGSL